MKTYDNLKERKQVYIDGIKLYKNKDSFPLNRGMHYCGFCYFIPSPGYFLRDLPELLAQKPKHPKYGGFWWKPDNRRRRLKALQDALVLINKKIKNERT